MAPWYWYTRDCQLSLPYTARRGGRSSAKTSPGHSSWKSPQSAVHSRLFDATVKIHPPASATGPLTLSPPCPTQTSPLLPLSLSHLSLPDLIDSSTVSRLNVLLAASEGHFLTLYPSPFPFLPSPAPSAFPPRTRFASRPCSVPWHPPTIQEVRLPQSNTPAIHWLALCLRLDEAPHSVSPLPASH